MAWSPNSQTFAVVYGYTPSKTTIFNSKAVPVHSFALAPRNTLRFSPTGRFLIVGGFGNFQGHIDVYDLEKDYEKVASIQASNASVCDWSPDGRHILTAVARLKVDNAIKIWHAGGGLMYNEDFPAGTELYHVAWRPQSSTSLPATDSLNPVPEPHASALAYLSTVKTPSKPAGAYRPPGARGTTTPLAFMREDQGGAAFVRDALSSTTGINGFRPRRRDVPGAESAEERTVPGATPNEDGELSKAALKNKKKREAKKAKDAADRLAPSEGQQGQRTRSLSRSPERRDRSDRERGDRRDHQRNRSRNDSELKAGERPRSQNRQRDRGSSQNRGGDYRNGPRGGPRGKSPGPGGSGPRNNYTLASNEKRPANPQIDTVKASQASAIEAPDLTVTTPGGSTPQDKKIRALTKKLRAIDDLRMRRARGETLEATQLKKMETEEAIKRELEGLGGKEQMGDLEVPRGS